MTEEQAHYTISTEAHEFSVETLHHFKCHKCAGWWTIGDWKPAPMIYCPHCGTRAVVQEIKAVED